MSGGFGEAGGATVDLRADDARPGVDFADDVPSVAVGVAGLLRIENDDRRLLPRDPCLDEGRDDVGVPILMSSFGDGGTDKGR